MFQTVALTFNFKIYLEAKFIDNWVLLLDFVIMIHFTIALHAIVIPLKA